MRLDVLLVLGIAAVDKACAAQGQYKMKLPQGLVVSTVARQLDAPLRNMDHERRDDCGTLKKSCNGGCISSTDVCCENGGVCALLETCLDDGTCCKESFSSTDCSGSDDRSSFDSSCRDNEEICGSKCMPTGDVCCPDGLTYCPTGTICDGDECKYEDAVGRVGVYYGSAAVAMMSVVLVIM